MRHLRGIVLVRLLIGLLIVVPIGAYSVMAQPTTSPANAIATAQAALQTAQAGLVTPTIAATATKAATATTVPTSTPRPAPTATARPTSTTAPTVTVAPTPTQADRIIRGGTATATVPPRPTERSTPKPTTTPSATSSAPPGTALQTYTVLVIIPTVYIVDGQTLQLPINEIQAARTAANETPGWVRELSNGMGNVAVTVVVDAYPVSTFRQYCAGTVCGNWVGPTDIQRAITDHGGAAAYDVVASFVPDNINGVDIFTCPCGGLAINRYMTIRMYGTTIRQTTVIHEFSHDVADFHLMRQGYNDLPTCDYDWTSVHCGYVYGGANWRWFGGLLAGTLDPALTNGHGITAEGWRYDTPTQLARKNGRDSAADDAFVWNGYEQPIAGHADPEGQG